MHFDIIYRYLSPYPCSVILTHFGFTVHRENISKDGMRLWWWWWRSGYSSWIYGGISSHCATIPCWRMEKDCSSPWSPLLHCLHDHNDYHDHHATQSSVKGTICEKRPTMFSGHSIKIWLTATFFVFCVSFIAPRYGCMQLVEWVYNQSSQVHLP